MCLGFVCFLVSGFFTFRAASDAAFTHNTLFYLAFYFTGPNIASSRIFNTDLTDTFMGARFLLVLAAFMMATTASHKTFATPIYTMTINELIDGVEIIAGGGFKLTSADILSSASSSFNAIVFLDPSRELIKIGAGQVANYRINGLTGPSFKAPGSFLNVTPTQTSLVGPPSGFSLIDNRLLVPWTGSSGTTRSAALNIPQARSFFDGATLGSLGVIAGSYDYTYGVVGLSGGMGEIQLRINSLSGSMPTPAPAPATLALLGLGLAGLGYSRRKKA